MIGSVAKLISVSFSIFIKAMSIEVELNFNNDNFVFTGRGNEINWTKHKIYVRVIGYYFPKFENLAVLILSLKKISSRRNADAV